jgi:hypothetical protein
MKRAIAVVFVVAILLSTVFVSAAGAVPGHGGGNGPDNGKARCTAGSLASPGHSYGVDMGKCVLD